MEFQNSETYKNLQNAFYQELFTSSKNLIYSQKAKEQEYIEIGDIFDITAQHDLVHAITWLRLLNNGEIPDTYYNLVDAYETNKYEGAYLYREYAQKAREEGFVEIAKLFDGVANIEMLHDSRFYTLAYNVKSKTLFCKKSEKLWICMKCGNLFSGNCAPEECPICGYSQGYYRESIDNC